MLPHCAGPCLRSFVQHRRSPLRARRRVERCLAHPELECVALPGQPNSSETSQLVAGEANADHDILKVIVPDRGRDIFESDEKFTATGRGA